MEQEKRPARMSVPQFGGWDQTAAGATNYSVVFSHARANKKKQKNSLTQLTGRSLGNEGDFINVDHGHAQQAPDDTVVVGKRRFLTYINCCIRP